MNRTISATIILIIVLIAAGQISAGSPQQTAAFEGYPRSDAFDANAEWHEQVGEHEIRMSYFLHGNPQIAMRCVADLSSYEVTTFREVHEHATQSQKTRKLSQAQVLTLRNVLKRLDRADEKPKLENLLTVSFAGDRERRIHLFDRMKPPREIIRLYDVTGAHLNAAVGDQPGDSSPSEEDAAKILFRSERARIDGTEPPTTWPEKVRRLGSAWIVDVDTSGLPGGYPEQFVLEVVGTGGHTGNPERPEPQWGEPVQGIAARLIVEKKQFSPDEPILGTFQLKKTDESVKLPEAIDVSSLSLSYRAAGSKMGAGTAMFHLPHSKPVPVKDVGDVFFRTELDLSRAFAPRINTDYEVRVGYHVGYEGSRSIKSYSRPVTIGVGVPEDKVLDYYLGELLAETAREIQRQEGDPPVSYPIDELVKIGRPAAKRLRQLALEESDLERFDRVVLSLARFGKVGAKALHEIARDRTGRFKALAERYAEMAESAAKSDRPPKGAEAASNHAPFDPLYAKLQRLVEVDTREQRTQARAALVAALRTRYAGKISGQTEIGSKEATEHSARMSELMRLWNPTGFAVGDVKSILGPPTREWKRGENDSFTPHAGFRYDFDFGSDGAHWQFTVEGDSVEPDSTISGIRYIPGE